LRFSRPWLDQGQGLGDPPPDLVLVDLLAAQAEGDVLEDVHVGEERVLLEDHVDVAPERRDADHVTAVEEDLAGGRLLEAGDHPQGGRLAAARGAQQREELALGDPQVDALDRPDVVAAGGELLLDPDQLDRVQAVLFGNGRPGARLDPGVCHRLVPCPSDGGSADSTTRAREDANIMTPPVHVRTGATCRPDQPVRHLR
jgi:hypothetical protein